MKHVFKEDLRITIINALVCNKLYYCSSVWSNTTDTNIRNLQSVQNFAARIVSNTKKYDHVTPVLKLYFRDAVMAFKYMTGMAREYLGNKFILRGNVSGRATRSSQQLNIPLFKLKQDRDRFLTELLIYGITYHLKLSVASVWIVLSII